jgi:hypothetical protein
MVPAIYEIATSMPPPSAIRGTFSMGELTEYFDSSST